MHIDVITPVYKVINYFKSYTPSFLVNLSESQS